MGAGRVETPPAALPPKTPPLDETGAIEKTGIHLPTILAKIGPIAETLTQRLSEMPYLLPPNYQTAQPGQPLALDQLNPDQVYVWVIDARGRFVFAPEDQPGFGKTEHHPDGRKVKHGDLAPGPDGLSRAAARAGGELKAQKDEDGQVRWVLDMNSSYCFNRKDGKILKEDSGRAVVSYLRALGSDTSNLSVGANVYDPLRHLAGRAYLLLDRLGLGGAR